MVARVPGDRADGIDPVIHVPARMKLMTQLFVVEAADATFLVRQTGLTWGNLSTHLSKLEEVGYVSTTKGFEGRKPRTMVSLTEAGRKAFQEYRSHMKRLLTELPE